MGAQVSQIGETINDLVGTIREKLKARGIDVDVSSCCGSDCETQVKVICVAPDLKSSVTELGRTPRDQVVMVRVDEDTSRSLDAWVASGAVRSRSEAAALFIREGLKLRANELEQLRGALDEVEKAQRRLRERAQRVLGDAAKS
jgi:Arc/MetJ-type ribon-helix-helix transcriptional regulator